MAHDTMALGPFLRQVQALAAALPETLLHARLLQLAGRLPPRERAPFLAALAGDTPPADPSLAADVDAFLARLEAGHYFREWSFHENRALGDESWAPELDALFSRASALYVAGALDVAAECYGRLLRAFLLEGEGEVFCGAKPAQEMLSTDLDEAKARYLRARYERAPLDQRAPLLAHELESLAHVGSWRLGLGALQDAALAPLPALDAFLPRWLEQLRITPREGRANSYPLEDLRRLLLREAVELWGGAAGLKALAREEGAWHPEAYGAWIDHLRREGDRAAAISAAREGLLRVEEPAERAALADRLALFAREANDDALLREALRGAFRAAPSAARLARLLLASPPGDRALAASLELEEARRREDPLPESLLVCLELLRGELRASLHALQAASPLGWSRTEHPGRILVPALLLAGCQHAAPPARSALARLWRDADREPGETPAPDASLARLLQEALASLSLPPDVARELLDACARTAERRARAIISNKHRRAYARAATVIAACAESYRLAKLEEEAARFVQHLREELRRHHSFLEELDRAL